MNAEKVDKRGIKCLAIPTGVACLTHSYEISHMFKVTYAKRNVESVIIPCSAATVAPVQIRIRVKTDESSDADVTVMYWLRSILASTSKKNKYPRTHVKRTAI